MVGDTSWDLSSSGRMASLVRGFASQACPLGPWSDWPAALRPVVELVLDAPHPAVVLWGAEHLCFYNDAYAALGIVDDPEARICKPAREVFQAYWDAMAPQLRTVLEGKGATHAENQLVPILRDGRIEPRYWTYSYSPVRDASAPHGIGGALILCQDTTSLVVTEQRVERERTEWQRLFDQAPTFNAVLTGGDHRFVYANTAYLETVHRSTSIIGHTVAEVLPEVVEQGFIELLDRVYRTGRAYEGLGIPVRLVDENGVANSQFVDFVFQPIRDESGAVTGIFVQGHDVTGRWDALQKAEEAEERLRIALHAAAMGVWSLERDGQLRLDARAADVLGYALQERIALGDLLASARPHERQRLEVALRNASATSQGFDVQLTLSQPHAPPKYVRVVGSRSVSTGGMQTVAGVVFDVSSEVQLQASRDQSLHRLELAKRAADLGLHVWHIQTRLIEWDTRTRELFGVAQDEQLTYDTFVRLLHPDDRAATEHAVQRSLNPRGDGRYAAEYRVVAPGPALRWIRATGEVAFEDGTPCVMTGMVQDITSQKLTEAALIEADRRKDAFLATLSHELRNPLTPIRTAATLLGLPRATAEQKAQAQRIIERQTSHMARLLEDLLDVARITRGALHIHPERLLLQSVIEAAIETAQPFIAERTHTLELAVPAEGIWVDADPVRLAQVLSNLLINAARYTAPGGRIALTASTSITVVNISIRDTGIGLTPDQLANVFNMFWQAEREDKRQGLGVGLALVKGLVQLHDGSVSAHSEGLGRGAEFTVSLPAATPASLQMQAPRVEGTSPLRVLVVDDNVDAADTLSDYLQHLGHRVMVAYAGQPALEVAAEFAPDVCLLDIGLPDMSGYVLASRLKAQFPDAEMAAITGWGREEDLAKAEAAGFRWHLTKPFDTTRLAALLAGLSARSRST